MYSYVPKSTVKPCKKLCMTCISEAQRALRKKHGITFQIYVVGSGSSNLVTRWDDEPFDMDFNAVIQMLPDEFHKDQKKLKDVFRQELDKALTSSGFSYGQDSTSAITYIHNDGTKTDFSLDIGIIITNNAGEYQRLIHNKATVPEQFIWNEVCDSHDIREKTGCIQKANLWNNLCDQYLVLKNKYAGNNDHPSFTIYVETVNLVWQTIPEKEKLYG